MANDLFIHVKNRETFENENNIMEYILLQRKRR